jgi:3-(3-hydroxy-phenyl)propionate hydroxylase
MTYQETINTKQYVPAIIVGAGPTGLTMGNLLGSAGIDTLILERNPGLSDLPKAIVLDDEGLRVCQAMGLLEPILQHVLLDVSAYYLSGKRLLARVAPTGNRNGFPLISTFQQPQFEAILLAGLKRFNCVNIAFQHTVEAFEQTEQGVTVTIRTPEGVLQNITCTYLLACDGGKSSIRRALGIPMQGSTFSQKWLVIDSIQDEDASTTITFFCNPQRPAVTVPSPPQCRRWEFMLLPGEQEADLLQPETIRLLIQQVGGAHNPHIIRQAIYTFHAVLARTFSKGRVFLLGDAAHQMPPFGGQGMNSGLRDARNLSWKLSLVLQGLANPSLLDTYNVERKEHSAQMINLSRFAGNVVMPTAKPVALFRDTIFLALNTIPAAREYFTELRIKPQPRYKKGFLLPRRVWASAERSEARFNPSASRRSDATSTESDNVARRQSATR